jgi:RHS repeat-associated protein
MSELDNFNHPFESQDAAFQKDLITPFVEDAFNSDSASNLAPLVQIEAIDRSDYRDSDGLLSSSNLSSAEDKLLVDEELVVNVQAVLENFESPEATLLERSLALSSSKLETFLDHPDALSNLNLAFGDDWHPQSALILIKDLITEKAIPEISIQPASTLQGKGGFDGQKIYLAEELFESKNPEEISNVFLEEFGHYLDSRLNTTDSEGDEGEIFSKLIQNLPLDLATLKLEDDLKLINLDGEKVALEAADLPGTFTVDNSGKISVDWMADAGSYQGELAVFSLNGMENLTPGSTEYIQEAARRALSNTTEGYVVLSDTAAGARVNGELGERNFNAGDYAGINQFNFTPGTKVALFLVPVGTVKQVFDNPTAEGELRPLFSVATANPEGKTHLGQLTAGTFGWEDIRFDNDTDADYNDIIVQIEGLSGEVTPIEELVSDQRDWLNSETAQEIISLVEGESIDSENRVNPVVTVQLANDSGSDSQDLITNDPEIVAEIENRDSLAKLEIQLNDRSWLDITDSVNAEGKVSISKAQLKELNNGALGDGDYQFAIRATDTENNVATPITLDFTLDTTAPQSPAQLQLANDEDLISSNNQPVITGAAPTAATVKIYSGASLIGEGDLVDDTWQISTNKIFADGKQPLKAVAIDAAGNLSTPSSLELLIDTTAPQLAIASPQYDSRIASGTRLQGTVNGTGSEIVQLSYQFNDLPAVPITFDESGKFDVELNLDKLQPGQQTLTVTTTDAANTSIATNLSLTLVLDRTAPRVEASLLDNTVAETATFSRRVSQNITDNPTIIGKVSDKNSGVTFLAKVDDRQESVDVSAYLKADGSFIFDRPQLDEINGGTLKEGEHTFSFTARDLFGNESEPLNLSFILDSVASVAVDNSNQQTERSVVITPLAGTIATSNLSNAAIKAEGSISISGKSDFDGEPLNLNDDALIYAGKGFNINGKTVLPVKRNAAGDPLTDASGKPILVDQAVTVASGYLYSNVSASNRYSGLVPPQIVDKQTIDVPVYTTELNGELSRRIPTGTPTVTFNVAQNPLNNAADWTKKFPAPGTATAPQVVKVTGGGLNIPSHVNLNNYVITVESGDLNFNGSGHNLNNTMVVTKAGNINFANAQTKDVKAFASGSINMNGGATFAGDSLLANNNASGSINFSGATNTINSSDELKVFSPGNITFNGASQTRGKFISGGNFTFNGNSTLYGAISAKGDITFNGNATVVGVNSNSAPSDLSLNPTTSPENVANNSVIGTFTTTDANSNDTHTLSLVAGTGDTHNNAFTIVGNQLRINHAPDFESLSSYSTRVRTTDNAGASFEKVFTVSITNVNEAPTQLNLSTNSVAENSALGTTIGNLSTIDPDANNTHTYSLVTGSGDTDNSAFTIIGNKLNLNKAVDFEGQPNYSIRLRTTDAGGLNLEQVIGINISDVNEAPTAIALSNLSINENVPNDSVVGIFNISDPDLNATHDLSLVAGSGDRDNAAFTIVGNQLRIKETPDFESKASYNIRVKATDVGGLSKETTLIISVNDLNEVPTDLSLSSINFDENLPINSQVAKLQTLDADGGDSHTLSLVAGQGDSDNNAFTINGDRLYFKDTADFEAKANYNLRVRTTDAAGNSLEKILYLNVNNVNEAPTQLNLSSLSIDENAAIDSIIGTFSTTDPDAGDLHTVSLVSGAGDTDNGVFKLVGNELRLNQSPDFESQSSYSIRVKTTDAGGLSAEQTFAISITDDAETPTDITLSATSVVENSPLETVVATLNTVDSDVNSTHTYELVAGEGDTHNSSFNLVGNKLRLNQKADFESKSNYSLRIRTTDEDGLFTEKAIAISVVNLNEAPTKINFSSTSVAENSSVKTVIATLSSSDPDAGDSHTYSLVAGQGDTDNSSFNLVGQELRLNKPADFESQASYSIRIRTTDAGGLFQDEMVIISVQDRLEAEIALNLNLAQDTGTSNSDRLTFDPTIRGTVENGGGDITLSGSLNGAEAVELGDVVGTDGSFTLGVEQLKQIHNGDLKDGDYTLQLMATDSGSGKTIAKELAFTLDTAAPTLNLITPLADGDHSSTARLTGTVDKLAALTYSLDGGSTGAVTVDAKGHFNSEIDSNGLELGSHNLKAIATDLPGNKTTTEVSFQVGDNFLTPEGTKGWGAKNDSSLILGEEDSYVVETSVPVELGLATNEEGELAGTRTISFDVDAIWDELDAKAIEDQLLVYLVDPTNPNQTLLDNGQAGTAIFSLAGEQSDFTPGLVTFDGKRVTIDASSLKDLDKGLLIFQLLNQDDDTGSSVSVNNLTSTTDLEGSINPVFPDDDYPVAAGAGLNFDNLTQANEVETIINNVRFDAATGEYRAAVSIKNNGSTAIARNSVVVFNNLPDGVELADPSGTDSQENPYVNLRGAIASGGLDIGGVSETVEVTFNNPNLLRFGLDTSVFVGRPNSAPVFAPIDHLTVIPGAKLKLPLTATDRDGDLVTYRLKADDTLPTGILEGSGTLKFNPKHEEIGSYEFTVIATDGAAEVSQTVTLDVVADPITTTRISGVIQNVEQQPLAGVKIELGALETVTAADGSFTIETDQPLTADTLKVKGKEFAGNKVYPSIAEKLPLLLEQEVYPGYNNIIDRPIYLPALDIAGGKVIDPNKDITVTTEKIPGASVFVEAGSLINQSGQDFTGKLSITEVPTELTPAALPENLSPDLVVTIQPGEMVFNTPAPITFPNRVGYEPGTIMDLWSINPETGDFDVVGKMKVSASGKLIETIEGGIRNSSWHFPAPPPPPPSPTKTPEEEKRNEDDKCPECKASGGFNSEVEYHSGAVIETHDLTSYLSNGSERGITLTYDSMRANPRPIIHFGYDKDTPLDYQEKILADLTIWGNGFYYNTPGYRGERGGQFNNLYGKNFWSFPKNPSGDLSVGLQADMQEQPSGLYNYAVNSGLYGFREFFGRNFFLGSSSTSTGKLIQVNSIESEFGSGWGIAGWQELIVNRDRSILLIDGDGSELLFEAATGGKGGYVSPPGDFSTLKKLPDGTFRRTMKDKTVYEFNSANDLKSTTDRNGNQTSYEYNSQAQLTKIVDPVGLATVFGYNEAGQVSKITDPGVRVTQLEYDTAGNLTRITDPGGATRTWSYDAHRLMVSETDERGKQERATYDQFGRAESAQLKDGSTVQVDPLQTQGLYSPEATINPSSAPNALIENTTPTTAYASGNGNVTVTEVDKAGQAVSAFDGAGKLPITERNQKNLITSSTDAKGNETKYTYDEQGNILTIQDSLSLANNVGGNALIINGAASSSEPQLTLSATNAAESLLVDSGYEITISEGIPQDISEYEQVWDLRFDNSAALSNTQSKQYLDFLKTGGNLLLLGENSVFKTRNSSVVKLIDQAGGGKLDLVLPNESQKVLAPFDSPRVITEQITFKAPGGVSSAGTGQFIATDEENRGVGVAFTQGTLRNAAAGELTTIFDLGWLADASSNVNLQKLLNNLAQLETQAALQSYSYDPVFNQVTSYTDELGRLTLNDIDPNNGNLLASTKVVGQVGGDDDLTTSYTYTDAGLVDIMTDPMGRVTDYQYDLKGRLVKEIQAVGTAEQAEISYEYDAVGNQTAVIDENGNRSEFEYDSQNRVTKITEADPDGVGDLTSPVTSLTYDQSGNLVKTVDPLGNTTEQEYDELNRLSLVIDSLGEKTSYEYDKAGNVSAIVDAQGRRTENRYDSRDRLTETIDPEGNKTKYKYDSNDNLIAVTDALGNKTRSFYDSRDRLFRTIDAEGHITNYEYDGADNLIATVDGLGHRTEFEYDDLDRQVKRIDAKGGESTIVYDAVGNVIATTDQEERTTELAYDSRDRLTSTTNALDGVASFEYDDAGNLISTTDEGDRTTNYEYDALNRQIGMEDPLGNTNQVSYDHGGNLTSATDGKGNIIHYAYDKLNRLSVVTNPFGDKMTTSYDAVSNVTSVTDELGRITTFEYDERNLQTSITDPLDHTSTTKYDAVGNAIALTDPLGNKTSYSYDQIYRLIATTDAENRTTNYDYDPVGNLLSLTDPEENTTSYTYDQLNRLITDSNQLGDTRTYGYDQVGNQIRTSDRNGRKINFTFDKLNRNTSEVWLDGNNNPVHTFEFEYDAASQLLNAHDLNSAYGYEYDAAGRLVEVDNAGTPDAPNVVLNYGYDAANNLIEVKDKINGVNKGVETFGYDKLNRVTKITQSGNGVADKRVDMSYDAASQMTGMTRFSDLAGTEEVAGSSYTFDDAGRLTNLVHDQDGDVLSAYEWAYDQGDRITKATTPDGVSDFTYDKSDQLVDADHSVQADESYVYDDNGNRINTGYVTGENNQLQSDGTYNYLYDKEGNRVKRTEIATGEVTNYEWDYRNRLVGVETKDSNGNVVERNQYTYDVFDNRIAKSVDADGAGAGVAKEEHFVYDGDHIALTFDGESNQTERFLHGTQIDQVLAQENDNGEVLWALTDNQGSVRMLLDNNGNVVNNITYDAFGNITLETNPDVNFRFSYTGRELDAETGLYNYRTRFLDPKTGQFINEDTIGFAGGDSNLYRYVTNSPVNYIDPFGERIATPARPPAPTRTPTRVPVIPPGPTTYPTINPNFPANPSTPTQNPPGYFPYENNDPSVPFKFPRIEPPEVDPSDPYNTNDWYEQMMDLLEDIEEQNQRQQEDNQPEPEIRACPANSKPPNNNDFDEEDDDDDDEKRRELYRGDSRKPNEIFESGFQPNGINTDLVKYVRNNEPSIYVGTSKKFNVGVGYATNRGRQPGFVYIISDPGDGIDVNQEFRRITGEGNPYFRDQEVAFPGGISTQDIRGAIPVGKDLKSTGLEISNPYYRRR